MLQVIKVGSMSSNNPLHYVLCTMMWELTRHKIWHVQVHDFCLLNFLVAAYLTFESNQSWFSFNSKCQKPVFSDISFYGHVWLRRGTNSSGSVTLGYKIFQTANIIYPCVFFLLSIYDHNSYLYYFPSFILVQARQTDRAKAIRISSPNNAPMYLNIAVSWLHQDNLRWEKVVLDTVRIIENSRTQQIF